MRIVKAEVHLKERDLERAAAGDLTEYLARVGRRWVDIAGRIVPVDTGDLRSTLRYDVKTKGSEPVLTCRAGGVKGAVTGRVVDYAVYVENGTSRQRAQPYMRTSLRYVATVLGVRIEWKAGMGR
ncbi:MAG: hypothetical protein D6683_04065 [Actinomyces sp.]|nr:MAG: hypothetical protein D6683_04065 [Actinomyces sp.]